MRRSAAAGNAGVSQTTRRRLVPPPRKRASFDLLIVVLLTLAGTVLVSEAWSERSWFTAGLGVFLLGQVSRRVLLWRQRRDKLRRVSPSVVRAFRTAFAAYVVAGGLVAIGGLTSLERGFGLIVAFAGLSWS